LLLQKIKAEEENAKDLTADDISELKNMIGTIRSKISDYYADTYSNECNIQ
jgi:hypothetical protein